MIPVYFSKKLKAALNEAMEYPLTVLEAESGYGKTTAVSEYFLKYPAVSCRCFWYTCMGEKSETAWKYICRQIAGVDRKVGHYLESMGVPVEDAVSDLAIQMRSLSCPEPTVIVLDNFQLTGLPQTEKILYALSTHCCENLHILVLTQPIKEKEKPSFMNGRIWKIGPQELSFSIYDIETFFKNARAPLLPDQLREAWSVTEGLAAAVHLQLINWKKEGKFVPSMEMAQQLETALWDRLNEKDQYVLTALAVLDKVTIKQAIRFFDGNIPEMEIKQLLAETELIRWDARLQAYLFHHLFRTYLQKRFTLLSEQEKQDIWTRAAKVCEEESDYIQAAYFYARMNDYKSLMALPYQADDRVQLVRMEEGMMIEKLLEEPWRSWFKEYPELLLSLTLELYIQGNLILHKKYMEMAMEVMRMEGKYEYHRCEHLKGEFALMKSFLCYNDIEEMCKCHKEAYRHLHGATKLYSLNTSWTFGAPSIVYMFWKEKGNLQKEFENLRNGMPTYYLLSNGNGSGAEYAMQGEIFLLSGQLKRAQETYGIARYHAQQLKQNSISYCSELGMARIALMQGDAEALGQAVEHIGQLAYSGMEASDVLTSELCLAYVKVLLGHDEEVPSWIGKEEGIRKKTLFFTIPYVHVLRTHLLLNQLIHGQRILRELKMLWTAYLEECSYLPMLLPKIYYYLQMTIAEHTYGNQKEAALLFCKAVEEAAADKVYMPFAEYYGWLRPVMDYTFPGTKNREVYEVVEEMGKRFLSGKRKILMKTAPKEGKLTEREMEIAVLLRQRLSVKEISQRLMVSPSTVRNTMQKIYTKLDIHSRKELIEIHSIK